MTRSEHGLSETISLILIAFLVIVVALFITMALTGVIERSLQKPALAVVTATSFDATGSGHYVIKLQHKEGNPVIVKGTTHSVGDSIVDITLVDDTGASHTLTRAGTFSTDSWSPGSSLYITADNTLTEDATSGTGFTAPSRTYTVKIIDTKPNVLLHSLDVTIP